MSEKRTETWCRVAQPVISPEGFMAEDKEKEKKKHHPLGILHLYNSTFSSSLLNTDQRCFVDNQCVLKLDTDRRRLYKFQVILVVFLISGSEHTH